MVGRVLVLMLGAGALRQVMAPGPNVDSGLSSSLGDLAVAALLLLGAWVVVTGVAVRLARLPGTLGATGRLVLPVLLPRALRVAVVAALGAQALVGTAVAADQMPAVNRPVTSAASVPETVTPPPARVRVQRGDSLWSIAAQHLSRHAPDRRVAAAWPAWYDANRSVIGPDPDLLTVGMVLEAPHGGRR
jgi:nucleoid-associated protein YgaU